MAKSAKTDMDSYEPPVTDVEALAAENASLKAELAALKGQTVHVPQPYPAMRYGPEGATVIVQDDASEPGEGWTATPPAVGSTYPAWRYHASDAPRMVKDAAEDAALGSGWTKPSDLVTRPA